MTKNYRRVEREDLRATNNPSSRGIRWLDYIEHKLRMAPMGIPAHTKRYYARLAFDKYMEVNRTLDLLANDIAPVGKSAAIYAGAAGDPPPNCPFKIKKHVRAPGTRRLLNSLKKRENIYVMRVDEYMTSQTCAKCGTRFDQRTRKHRFKVCRECYANPEMMLPSRITTHKGRHLLRTEKKRLTQQNEVNRMNIVFMKWFQISNACQILFINSRCFCFISIVLLAR